MSGVRYTETVSSKPNPKIAVGATIMTATTSQIIASIVKPEEDALARKEYDL